MSGERPVRVLVFPSGSEIGLELHRALGTSRLVELWGAASTPDTHGPFVYQRSVDDLPWPDDERFLPELCALIARERIDLVYPAHDTAVVLFAEHAAALGWRVIGSPFETAYICRSKRRTYEALAPCVAVPDMYDDVAHVHRWPVFLKPDEGQGSRGTYRAENAQQVRTFLQRDPSLLVLEYLPGPEFTVDCFTDRHGKLRFVGPRSRQRVQNGISVHTAPVQDERLQLMAQRINDALRLRGAWFFQAKENAAGAPVLLEVAARIAGSMAVHRVHGVNLPLLSVFDALGRDVELRAQQWEVEMDRALVNRYRVGFRFDHVYVDLDDCIIRNDVIEPVVAAFLVQCVARGVALHLVTRHAHVLEETLRRHRLEQFFDDVVHCDADTPKSAYVTEPSAIFIDDSFRERDEVARTRGIPVFDLDGIECLIDWRR